MTIKSNEYFLRIISIQLEDRVDAFNVAEVREKIYTLIDGDAYRLVIDLTRVTFLDSMSMSILVSSMKRAHAAGGSLKLVWPESQDLQRTIRLAKFDVVFQIYDTVDEAVNSY